MITDDRMEKALKYLATTDETMAELKTSVERAHYKLKRTKAALLLTADGTVAEKESKAITSQEYIDVENEYLTAYLASESMVNKRKSEELITRVWQTVSANRRQG
jgi:predicted DNA binding CopG/RHH family protein